MVHFLKKERSFYKKFTLTDNLIYHKTYFLTNHFSCFFKSKRLWSRDSTRINISQNLKWTRIIPDFSDIDWQSKPHYPFVYLHLCAFSLVEKWWQIILSLFSLWLQQLPHRGLNVSMFRRDGYKGNVKGTVGHIPHNVLHGRKDEKP